MKTSVRNNFVTLLQKSSVFSLSDYMPISYSHFTVCTDIEQNIITVVAVICHMEGSGKWPHDRLAIRHIRAAFHIRLGELLKNHHNYTCRACPTHLDVLKVTFFYIVCMSHTCLSNVNYFYIHAFSPLLFMYLGWLGVPHPSGIPSWASGAEGECECRRDADCKGQRGGSSSGDGHHSQAFTYQHTARVNITQ